MGRLVLENEHYQLLTQYPKGRCVIHKPCLSIFAESVYRLILFFNASNTRLLEVQKFRIRIEKTRPTKTGTLRILHSSLSHSLIGRGGQITGEASRTQSFPGSLKYRVDEKEYCTSFRDLASLSLQLFSMWPRVFAFVCICTIKFVPDRVLCFS